MKKFLPILMSVASMLLLILAVEHPALAWYYDAVVLGCTWLIGAGLVGICYLLKPIEKETGFAIVDGGYWSGFAVVILCLFVGVQVAA